MKINKIAVLISFYKGDQYFNDLVTSLFNQDYKHFDIHIRVDDSDNNIPTEIRERLINSSFNVFFYNGVNIGFSKSFLTLLKKTFESGYKFYLLLFVFIFLYLYFKKYVP